MKLKTKIAILNFSGNVGKSTVAEHILMPRLPTASLIRIESVNATGNAHQEAERLRGSQFEAIQDRLIDTESVVLDVGASNLEAFMENMARFYGSHEDVDVFAIPVVPDTKQQIDTITSIKCLNELGVEADRIRVVFNRVPFGDTARDAFPAIFGFHQASKRVFTLRDDASIEETEIFDKLKALGMTFYDAVNDTTNYRAQIAAAETPEAREELKSKLMVQRLAKPLQAQFERVFGYIVA
jgi:MinD-like ATPase involved in chromosome partitioning or flagellar assembly